jgi:gamma-glutamyltranspeptidase
MTTTINTLFGSKVIVPETGVILNNEMNGKTCPIFSTYPEAETAPDFSIPGVANDKGFGKSQNSMGSFD